MVFIYIVTYHYFIAHTVYKHKYYMLSFDWFWQFDIAGNSALVVHIFIPIWKYELKVINTSETLLIKKIKHFSIDEL